MVPPEDIAAHPVPDQAWSTNKDETAVMEEHNELMHMLIKHFDDRVTESRTKLAASKGSTTSDGRKRKIDDVSSSAATASSSSSSSSSLLR